MPHSPKDFESHVSRIERRVTTKRVGMKYQELLLLLGEIERLKNLRPRPFDRLRIAYYEMLWHDKGKQAANEWRDDQVKFDSYLHDKSMWRRRVLMMTREFDMK